jgi:molecular chaperone GrpE
MDTTTAEDSASTVAEEPVLPAEVAEVSVESAEAAEAAPADPLAEALAEVAKWKDQAYRHAAELDNFRKRMARETQEARQYANADLLRSLLPITDNFDMGLESARLENDKSIIYIGMNMVARQMQEFIKEQGATEVLPGPGAAFDPHQHEAISQEPSDEVAEGAVLRCARRGFKLKDRLLRAANVVVSSGVAKVEAAAE